MDWKVDVARSPSSVTYIPTATATEMDAYLRKEVTISVAVMIDRSERSTGGEGELSLWNLKGPTTRLIHRGTNSILVVTIESHYGFS
jgi:hypothetical protein